MDRTPQFIVYTGPMFSGKSTLLLAAIDRFQRQGMGVLVVKPNVDGRYSATEVVTHAGGRHSAFSVTTGDDILRLVRYSNVKYDVVAVDEVFMIDGAAAALIEIFRSGVTVLAASIDMSSDCAPFDELRDLLPWATRVEKIPAVCSTCHADAHYTHRRSTVVGPVLQVGGSELYEPRCFRCHPSLSHPEVV